MWVILPIGHDQGIRHFPWVTAGIAALCLLVQVHRTAAGPSDQEMIAAISARAELEQELLMPHVREKLKQLQRRPGAGMPQLREI